MILGSSKWFNLTYITCALSTFILALALGLNRGISHHRRHCYSLADVIPYPEDWNTVQTVHVTHVGNSISEDFLIPAETVPYRRLWVRTSATGSQQVHICVVHEDGRERAFCALDPAAVYGIATRIPGLVLTTLTVATTAVALNVLSNSSWPTLGRMRLVSDTYYIAGSGS